MISGHATPDATAAFAAHFTKVEGAASGHFRTARGLTLSSIGLGTYLGDANDDADGHYREAIVEYVKRGGNVIDTAVNYRAQRSERAVGAALRQVLAENVARRESIVVCTKVGFFSFDNRYPRNARETRDWVEENFVSKGIVHSDDVAQGCHAISPDYLRHQVRQSRANLDLDTIDIYYLHNPETQLRERDMDRAEFNARMYAAFETMEEFVKVGYIRFYGVATWNGFRVPPTNEEYLSLEDLTNLARSVAGDGHHMRFIQAPMNLAMLEAIRFANQRVRTQLVPLFEAARQLDVACVASASLFQGKLCSSLPPQIAELFPGFATDAQRALQFNRSAPNVLTALAGMGRVEHVVENLTIVKRPPAPVETTKKLLLKLA